eukprot:jgi/Tetstr1/465477/TSEL_010161.t1
MPDVHDLPRSWPPKSSLDNHSSSARNSPKPNTNVPPPKQTRTRRGRNEDGICRKPLRSSATFAWAKHCDGARSSAESARSCNGKQRPRMLSLGSKLPNMSMLFASPRPDLSNDTQSNSNLGMRTPGRSKSSMDQLGSAITKEGRSSSVVPKQEGKTDSDAVPQTPEAEAAQLPTGDKLLPQRLDANMKTAISTMQKFASAREARHQRTRAAVGDHVIKTRIRVLENSIQCPDEVRISKGTRSVKVAYLKELHALYQKMHKPSASKWKSSFDSMKKHRVDNSLNKAMRAKSGMNIQACDPPRSGKAKNQHADATFGFADWLRIEFPFALELELQLMTVAALKRNPEAHLLERARQAFRAIDVHGKGHISRDQMEDYCLAVYNDVYSIILTLPRRQQDDLYKRDLPLRENDFVRWYIEQNDKAHPK